MKIGNPGVEIQEYSVSEIGDTDQNRIVGYIQPGCKKPGWILWFTNKGDAILHQQRDYSNGHTGAVIDEPLKLKSH